MAGLVLVVRWNIGRTLLHPNIELLWQEGRKQSFASPFSDGQAISAGNTFGILDYGDDVTFTVEHVHFAPRKDPVLLHVRQLLVVATTPSTIDQHMFYHWVAGGLRDRDDQLFRERLRQGGYPETIEEYSAWCAHHPQ